MISNKTFKKFPLSFPEVEETPHFEKVAYKVKKKIFVTHNIKENRCCVKLSAEDQSLFCLIDQNMIYPVPNAWGKQGWTLVNLKLVNKDILNEILKSAYCNVAPAKLAQPYLDEINEAHKNHL
jgi:predicted DNA-binding protein (MmcQ/YjbR family)